MLSVIYLVFTTEPADTWGAALLLLISGCGSPRAVRLWVLDHCPGKLLLLFALQSNFKTLWRDTVGNQRVRSWEVLKPALLLNKWYLEGQPHLEQCGKDKSWLFRSRLQFE